MSIVWEQYGDTISKPSRPDQKQGKTALLEALLTVFTILAAAARLELKSNYLGNLCAYNESFPRRLRFANRVWGFESAMLYSVRALITGGFLTLGGCACASCGRRRAKYDHSLVRHSFASFCCGN